MNYDNNWMIRFGSRILGMNSSSISYFRLWNIYICYECDLSELKRLKLMYACFFARSIRRLKPSIIGFRYQGFPQRITWIESQYTFIVYRKSIIIVHHVGHSNVQSMSGLWLSGIARSGATQKQSTMMKQLLLG